METLDLFLEKLLRAMKKITSNQFFIKMNKGNENKARAGLIYSK